MHRRPAKMMSSRGKRLEERWKNLEARKKELELEKKRKEEGLVERRVEEGLEKKQEEEIREQKKSREEREKRKEEEEWEQKKSRDKEECKKRGEAELERKEEERWESGVDQIQRMKEAEWEQEKRSEEEQKKRKADEKQITVSDAKKRAKQSHLSDSQEGEATSLKKRRKDTMERWSQILNREDLRAIDDFAVVSSRLSPTPSNTKKYQHLVTVSGAEIERRCSAPEKMSTALLCQMLRLGKGKDASKSLSTLLHDTGLISAKKTSSTKRSSFSLLTEGEASQLVIDLEGLLASQINTSKLSMALWKEAPGSSTNKVASLKTTQSLLQRLCHEATEFEDLDSFTHGSGPNIIKAVLKWVIYLLELSQTSTTGESIR